jgi:hypothetical protein
LLPTPLKSSERSVLFDPTSDTIYSLVQRVSHTYMFYPRGIPKVAYIHVVLSVHPCTICKHTSSGPFTYIRTRNKGVCLLILAYVHSRGLGLGFKGIWGLLGYNYGLGFLLKPSFVKNLLNQSFIENVLIKKKKSGCFFESII